MIRPSRTPSLALILTFLAVPGIGTGAAEAAGVPEGVHSRERVEPSAERVLDGARRIERDTGRVVTISGIDWRSGIEDPEQAARAYLSSHPEFAGLDRADLGDLELRLVSAGKAADIVRFRQVHDGRPVHGAEIAVTVRRGGMVRYVSSTYRPGITLSSMTPTVDLEAARAHADAFLRLDGAIRLDSADLVVYADADSSHLAWRITRASTDTAGEWQVLVDAHDGAVLRSENLEHYIDGVGNVFDPDPLSTALATYGDPGYVDGNDATTPELDAELFLRLLPDITEIVGTFHLTGPWAEAVDWDSPFKGTFPQPNPEWMFNRFDDAFEAANTYYHLDTYMRYLNLTLGVTIEPHQYPGGVQYDPHGFNGADNSSYSTGTGRLRFGEGGVDDAEDADVVIHELGHGLHDWVTAGGLSQGEGLSEGIGDYAAQSYSRVTALWAPTDPQYHWVFSWDGHNAFWNGRVSNWLDSNTYPDDLTGSIHTDGQFWSSCMMRLLDAIGRDQTERAHWEGIRMTGSGADQTDAAIAVMQAAEDLGFSGSEVVATEATLQGCGYPVQATTAIFADGFESGDTSAWSSTVP